MATSPPYPWPNSTRACITITMDNMGEAADLHRGIWPSTTPIGSHYSVLSTLPRMLSILQSSSISATYFIEAWNLPIYPSTITTLQSSGHEIAFHAYQHEVWKNLDAETEHRNLELSLRNAGERGVRYKGFRPPGGLVTERTLGLMRGCGMRYLSPAAARPAVVDGVAMLPFQWESIDAYFYMESTKGLRAARGDSEEVLSPGVLRRRLLDRVEKVVEEGGYMSLLFHPFLQTSEERLEVMAEVVAFVKAKEREGKCWVPKCEEAAEWILEHEEAFGNDPGWDRAEWKKN